MFKLTTPAPGKGPYLTSVPRNYSQLEIIASFHTKSRRLLMLVVKNKSVSLPLGTKIHFHVNPLK